MANSVDFLVNIQQKLTGQNAVTELKRLQDSLVSDGAAIKQFEAALDSANLKLKALGEGGPDGAVDIAAYKGQEAAIKDLTGALGKKKEALGQTQSALDIFGGSLASTSAPTKSFADDITSAKSKLAEFAGGPIGQAIGVLLGLGAAFAAATVAVVYFALQASGAKQHLTNLLEASTRSTAEAQSLSNAVSSLASRIPVAKERLGEMARSLAVAGLKGKEFQDSLAGIATVAAVAGDEAANKLKELVNKSAAAGKLINPTEALTGTGIDLASYYTNLAKELGIGVDKVEGQIKAGKVTFQHGLDALNASIKDRFGAIAAKQMLEFNTQILKSKENTAALFEDVKTDGFLEGLHSVLGLVDQNNASGRALKLIFGTVLDGLLSSASTVFPYIKGLVQGMIIGALQLYIALAPVIRAMSGIGDSSAGVETTVAGMVHLGEVLARVTAVAIAVGYALLWPFIKAGQAIFAVVGATQALAGAIESGIGSAVSFIAGIDLASIGRNLIAALATGITQGAGAVADAVRGIADNATSTLKAALGIHSPSTVFRAFGVNVSQGMAEGVEANSSAVGRAVSNMTPEPEAKESAARSGGTSGNQYVLNFYGVKDAEDARDRLRGDLVDVLEGVAAEAGV